MQASPNLETPTPAPSRIFVAEVAYLPDNARPTFPRDIEGSILAANGAGVDGVRVEIKSPGWRGAIDVSHGGGSFKFTVEGGTFSVQPLTINAQAASVSVDGTARVAVVFRERDVRAPATPVPTPPPTLTSLPTLTPLPSPSPSSSPSVSPTQEQEATPRPTPAPLVGGPIVPAKPTATAPSPPRTQPPTGGELDVATWVRTFVAGFLLGGLLLVAGLGLRMVRR